MSWYRTGTATFTNGSAVVTGAGTNFVANALAGYAMVGPDNRTYEIASIQSATQLTLASNYQGATAAGQAYSIFPTHSATLQLVGGVQQLIADYAGVRDGAGAGLFADGTAAAPGLRFVADQDTGVYRAGANQLGFSTAGTLRLSILANGNCGIGHTNPPYRLVVSNAGGVGLEVDPGTVNAGQVLLQCYNRTTALFSEMAFRAADYRFSVGSSEKIRIDAGGRLLCGAIAPIDGEQYCFRNSSTSHGLRIAQIDAGDYYALTITHGRSAGATNGYMVVFRNAANAVVGNISSSGSATAFNTSSDERLKKNIEAAPSASDIIDNINVVQYDWIAGGSVSYGVVAQELFQIFPEAVAQGDDGEFADERPWAVDYSKLVPLLVKEVQELRKRIAALEPAGA